MPLNGTAVATATCDEVHFGGVELFRDGIWGRICVGRFGGDPEEFTLDAQVVCRQLGFPFGSVMDEGEVFGAYDYSFDYSSSEPEPTVWATEVRNTFLCRHCFLSVPVPFPGPCSLLHTPQQSRRCHLTVLAAFCCISCYLKAEHV